MHRIHSTRTYEVYLLVSTTFSSTRVVAVLLTACMPGNVVSVIDFAIPASICSHPDPVVVFGGGPISP